MKSFFKLLFSYPQAFCDDLFSFAWAYRKIRGGMWYRVAVIPLPQLGTFWTKKEPVPGLEFLQEEQCL